MYRLCITVAVVPLAVVASCYAKEAHLEQKEAITEIKEFDGKVIGNGNGKITIDEKSPEKASIDMNFIKTTTTDADVHSSWQALPTNESSHQKKGGSVWGDGIAEDCVQFLLGVIVTAGSFIVGRLYERWKPIYFRVSSWQLNPDGHVDCRSGACSCYKPGDNDGSATCCFKFNFFSKKTDTIGLHEIGFEFRDRHEKCLFTVDNLSSQGFKQQIPGVDLPPNTTVTLDGCVSIRAAHFSFLPQVRSIYFVGYSTEGKNKVRKWLVTHYEYHAGDPDSYAIGVPQAQEGFRMV